MSKLKEQQEGEIKEGQWKTFIKDSDYFDQKLGSFYRTIYFKILDVKKEENQSVSDFHRILDQKAKNYKGDPNQNLEAIISSTIEYFRSFISDFFKYKELTKTYFSERFLGFVEDYVENTVLFTSFDQDRYTRKIFQLFSDASKRLLIETGKMLILDRLLTFIKGDIDKVHVYDSRRGY